MDCEVPVDEDSDDSSVDDIVNIIKEHYPGAIVNVVDNKQTKLRKGLEDNSFSVSQNETCRPNEIDPGTFSFDDLNNLTLPSSNSISFTDELYNNSKASDGVNFEQLELLLPSPKEFNDEVVETSTSNINNTEKKIDTINSDCISNSFPMPNHTEEENDVDDPDWIPATSPEPNNPDDPECDNDNVTLGREKKQRKRKIFSQQSEWHDKKNKKLRETGKSYIGWTRPKNSKAKRGPQRGERKLGKACDSEACKKSTLRQCQVIQEDERKEIFTNFWEKLSWDQQKLYIVSLVTKCEKKESKKKPGEESRRKVSYAYNLKRKDGSTVPVCKKFFLNTLALKEWSVMSWVSAANHGITPSRNVINAERKSNRSAANEAKQILHNFLDKLPKLPSHYCRQSTNKVYVEPVGGNMTDIYNMYKQMCETNDGGPVKPLSRFTFDQVVEEKNISFQPPKKDRCDTCIAYEVRHVVKSDYDAHIKRKEVARIEKDNDKLKGEKGECFVLTQDLQSVKVCPSLNASALYYKTKLICHNFTIFNINTHTARCYWFDESQADLTANTFASCVIDFLKDFCVDQKPVILWSDGCTAQNRNAIFSNALLSFCNEKQITITQKFLEKGHTQMEVDSVHATIERKLKNKPIYLPSDYIRYTQEARNNPSKSGYETKSVTYDMIFDFSAKNLMMYDSIRPGKKPGDPTVTDIKSIQYFPNGDIKYQLEFGSKFVELPQRKKLETPTSLSSFAKLHQTRLKISHAKWKHLQELKFVIPTDCHSFYDNLIFSEDLPSTSTSQRKTSKKSQKQ